MNVDADEGSFSLGPMVPGRSGFGRMTELFSEGASGPIDRYHPIYKTAEIQTVRTPLLLAPPSLRRAPVLREGPLSSVDSLDELAMDLYEWLALVSLESPRICAQDSIDFFLSRYAVPNGANAEPQRLVKIRWNGLLPARWISKLWMKTLLVPP